MEHLVQYLIAYRYWALIAAAFVEGPMASFAAGTLVALGYFNPFAAFGILAAKDLVLDTAFYGIGRLSDIPFFAKRIERIRAKTGFADRALGAMEKGWAEHPAKLMWITKLAYGLSGWLLISAGIAGLPFRKLYLYTLPVTAFQFGGLMTLGYFLGVAMGHTVNRWLTVAEIVVALVGIFFIVREITRYIRRQYVEHNPSRF